MCRRIETALRLLRDPSRRHLLLVLVHQYVVLSFVAAAAISTG
jgi:hypothetical protein